MYYTLDGGNLWIKQKYDFNNNLYDIFFVNDFLGWAVGENGIILHTTNGGITFVEEESINKNTSSCYPNPFSETATIEYTLKEPCWVKLCIYDFLGKEVALLINEFQDAGEYRKSIDGSGLSPGMYYYVLNIGNKTITQKIIISE